MTPGDIRQLLRLSLIPGIGPITGRQLLGVFGSAHALWQASAEALAAQEGIGPKLVQALRSSDERQADRIIESCTNHGIRLLGIGDADYPERLAAAEDAPLVLYALGDAQVLGRERMLSVVGARKAGREGRLLTRRWCRQWAAQDTVIVSGMAQGIDAAAHAGALEADGITVAVLGCGLLAVDREEQRRQIEAIVRRGCVISEFAPDVPARPEHFPRRNRIIAALSPATVVMEADQRSGSLITAHQALAYGREVFAVPGSVLGGNHAGCHQLIRDGAGLADGTASVTEALGWDAATDATAPRYEPASPTEAMLLAVLKQGVAHVDALCEQCHLSLPELSPILLALELRGVIDRLPGDRYTLVQEI
ncbi:MAG TPA: DNA-processing protein DprA [Mariprofundaceae bacterium]|nr:DNA-processing protein DprA [Mariprofundaceae bacterium]